MFRRWRGCKISCIHMDSESKHSVSVSHNASLENDTWHLGLHYWARLVRHTCLSQKGIESDAQKNEYLPSVTAFIFWSEFMKSRLNILVWVIRAHWMYASCSNLACLVFCRISSETGAAVGNNNWLHNSCHGQVQRTRMQIVLIDKWIFWNETTISQDSNRWHVLSLIQYLFSVSFKNLGERL